MTYIHKKFEATDVNKQIILITPGYFSIGLVSIGSFLESHGYDVQVIPETLSTAPFSSNTDTPLIKRLSAILDKKRCVAIGVTAMTPNIVSAIQISKIIKRNYPDIPLLLGGNHVTALPERTLAESDFDIGVIGEGELTTLEVIKKLKNHVFPTQTAGTFEKLADGRIINNGRRPLIPDLSILPPLNYDLFHYHPARLIRDRNIKAQRAIHLLVSRGCPYTCAFCSSELIWERKLRFPPIEHIMEHIEFIVEKYSLDSLCFLDDELITSRKFITSFCAEFIRRNLHKKAVWACQARVKAVQDDLLELLKKAGCRLISFGMESGSDKILQFLKCGTIAVQDSYNAVKLCNKHGINCFGSFVIGSPDENLDDIIGTINLIEESGLNAAACFSLVPYPGTRLYQQCADENLLKKDISWNDFILERHSTRNTPPFTMRNRHFSAEQLYNITRYIEQNVIKKLNLGLSGKKTDHRRNLERIIAGESELANPKLKIRLYEKKDLLKQLIARISAEPQPLRFLATKVFLKLRRICRCYFGSKNE